MLAFRKSLIVVVGLAVSATLLGGCVAQEEYDSLRRQIDSLDNSNQLLTKERDQARRDLDAARSQLTLSEAALAELKRLNADLVNRLGALGANLTDLQSRMSDINLRALDPQTDGLLRDLAARYPDLIQYDAARGMLRFASDLTFDSGSDAVKSEARQSLAALADILKNPAAEPYEVIVVGHTDAQRISAGTATRHPTNVHLSAHRAISVRRALIDSGVVPGKMQVAGWGEFRPAVSNNMPSGNTPANRRVEIYLTRSKLDGGSGAAAPAAEAPAMNEAAPARGNTPSRPAEILK